MPTFKTEGIILKRTNFQEADRLLTVLTKNHGKIKIVAKGARRVTSRKASSIELFNLVQLTLATGRNFEILTDAQVINNFSSWRKDLKRIGVSYYFVEVIDKLIPDKQENQIVFGILKSSLEELDKPNLSNLIRNFERNILEELGYGIPDKLKGSKGSLKDYLEEIIEKKIVTPKIIHELIK